MLSNTKEELVRYLTKREFVEKLLIDIRERATDGQIRSVKEVLKDYFGFSVSSDDDDTIMRNFKNKAQDKLETFGEIMIEYRVKVVRKRFLKKHWNRSRCLKTVRPMSGNRKSWIMLPRWKLL